MVNDLDSPFFSIGVTTYDRVDLLGETVRSILAQTFPDFEIIISNDNPGRKITAESLSILDPRCHFINQEKNLGEFANMNFLLGASRGRYFTWIADDDLYAPNFLEEIHNLLMGADFPSCIFTAYGIIYGTSMQQLAPISGSGVTMTGPAFLSRFLKGDIRTISVMGAFDANYLRQTGGLEDVSRDNRGLFCEYMLLIRAGVLEKIGYIDSPLVYYRSHEGAWGIGNRDIGLYRKAGRFLLNTSLPILGSPSLQADFSKNLFGVLKICLSYVFGTASKEPSRFQFGDLLKYHLSLKRELLSLADSPLYRTALRAWTIAGLWLLWPVFKFRFKHWAPAPLVGFAVKLHSAVRRRL